MEKRSVPGKLVEGLTDKKKKEVIEKYELFEEISEKLRKIFENKVTINRVTRKSDFASPSWPYQRAFQDGYIQGIKEVLDYLPGEK